MPTKNIKRLRTVSLIEGVNSLLNADRDPISAIDAVCDRIDALDPQIQALLEETDRRRRLRRETRRLVERFPASAGRPVLFGALVAVKDIFRVDGFETRAGSRLPPFRLAGPQALSVVALMQAGALVLGKSVTTEFAFFEPGPTKNPHRLSHTPGGSSSGSAAAVAAGYCALALGTQTIGSVIRPAAYCGVVGFKPTRYRIPTQGLVYFSRSMDQVGLFTQDIPDMILGASVLCQAWRPVSVPERMPVLGIPEGSYLQQADPEGLNAFEAHLSILERAGCRLKRVPCLADIHQINTLHRQLVFAEFAREHREWYAEFSALYRPRTREIIDIGQGIDDRRQLDARQHACRLQAILADLMQRRGIDLWVSPPAPGPAPKGLKATGDPKMNLPWTHAGMPVVALPAGYSDSGLPMGLQLAAAFGADERLLAWCRRLEPILACDRAVVNRSEA